LIPLRKRHRAVIGFANVRSIQRPRERSVKRNVGSPNPVTACDACRQA
jgi:hypothetical protein